MNSDEQNERNAAAGPARRRDKFKTALKFAQVTLMAIGVVFAGVYSLAQIESYFSSRAAIERFHETLRNTTEAQANGAEITNVQPSFEGWSEERIRAYEKTSELQIGIPMATLKIAKVNIEAPVFEGTDALTLNHAVGHIEGTAQPGAPGNIGIAGHRDGFFRGLKGIRPGDQVELRTRAGADFYAVDHIEIVSPREVRVLKTDGNSTLTLVTCYPFYFIGGAPKRFVVKANLTQHIPAGELSTQPRLNTQPINPSEEN